MATCIFDLCFFPCSARLHPPFPIFYKHRCLQPSSLRLSCHVIVLIWNEVLSPEGLTDYRDACIAPTPDCGGNETCSSIRFAFCPLMLLLTLLCVSYGFLSRPLLSESNNTNSLESVPQVGPPHSSMIFSRSSRASHGNVFPCEASSRRPSNGRNAAVAYQCPPAA